MCPFRSTWNKKNNIGYIFAHNRNFIRHHYLLFLQYFGEKNEYSFGTHADWIRRGAEGICARIL